MEHGRVRPLSTLVPHGSEFPSICGRGGKGTKKADRAEQLTFYIHTELRNFSAMEKMLPPKTREDTRIKSIIPTPFISFIFKNR